MSLRQLLEKKGIESCMLDDTVHEAASREASRINNEGMKEQLEYLERQGMTDAEILDCLGVDE